MNAAARGSKSRAKRHIRRLGRSFGGSELTPISLAEKLVAIFQDPERAIHIVLDVVGPQETQAVLEALVRETMFLNLSPGRRCRRLLLSGDRRKCGGPREVLKFTNDAVYIRDVCWVGCPAGSTVVADRATGLDFAAGGGAN